MADLRTLLDIELPIIQAPMAGVQTSALAIAVSNAGGLGSLPCAMLSAADLRQEIATLTSQTSRPYNVNFFCHQPPARDRRCEDAWKAELLPYFEEFGLDVDAVSFESKREPFSEKVAEVLSTFRPPIVSFHFGLPAPELLAKVRALGAKVLSTATTVAEAVWLEAHGVDAIIAQGAEAGGHRGMFLSDDSATQMGTFALVPQIVRAVGVPVIAAGGIADAAGVKAAMALGACGVQLGTAYMLCPEATTSRVHRLALQSAQASDTVITNVFTGRPARSIVNRFIREKGPINPRTPAFPLAAGALAPLRAKAESMQSGDFSPMWAGQNTSGSKEVPAGRLTRELCGFAS